MRAYRADLQSRQSPLNVDRWRSAEATDVSICGVGFEHKHFIARRLCWTSTPAVRRFEQPGTMIYGAVPEAPNTSSQNPQLQQVDALTCAWR